MSIVNQAVANNAKMLNQMQSRVLQADIALTRERRLPFAEKLENLTGSTGRLDDVPGNTDLTDALRSIRELTGRSQRETSRT